MMLSQRARFMHEYAGPLDGQATRRVMAMVEGALGSHVP
jgi:hypothetical protein